MKQFLNNLKTEASHIRMSNAEKVAMRARIFGVPSPLAPSKVEGYFFFSYQFRMVTAGLLVFVLAGAGTASAAQGSLPGDILYPIKVNITEPVEVALAPTPEAKAEVQATLATRRVEEAQTLASRGKLDIKTAEALSVDFDEHSAQALALAGEDGQKGEDFSDNKKAASSLVAPEAPKKSERVRATMTLTVAPDFEQATITEAVTTEATATPEQETRAIEKSTERRGALKELLRAKSELLFELKSHASSSKDGGDNPDGGN